MRPHLFRLAEDGTTPIGCHDAIAWAQWFETADRVVAQTPIGQPPVLYVSTVFIGVDYSWGLGPPRLWETLNVAATPDGADFRAHGEDLDIQARYTSHEAAHAGHDRIVAALRAKYEPEPA